MERVLSFLRQLECNNNKTWFDSHRSEYLEIRSFFEAFVSSLIEKIGEFDPTIVDLTVKDCTYRINKDMRFSRDKLPYKRHLGAYIVRGGKKSGYSGYYFHIGTGSENSYPAQHLLAIGNYFTEPAVLKILREDIDFGKDDFDQIIKNQIDTRLSLDQDNLLKKVPKGFSADSPNAEYFKLKNFCLSYHFDDSLLLSDSLLEEVVAIFKSAKPFLDYINRAIEFSKEEQNVKWVL